MLKFLNTGIWVESHSYMFLKFSLKIESLLNTKAETKSHVTNDHLERVVCQNPWETWLVLGYR